MLLRLVAQVTLSLFPVNFNWFPILQLMLSLTTHYWRKTMDRVARISMYRVPRYVNEE